MKPIQFFIILLLLSGFHFADAQIARPRNPDFDPKPMTMAPNPKNPFDVLGQEHNDGVAEIGNLLGWRKYPKDTLYNKTVWYMTKEGYNDFATQYNARKNFYQSAPTKTATQIDSMLLKQGATRTEIAYMHRLMTIMDNPKLTSASDVIAAIKQMEDQVMADATISADVENLFLASASVARYSLELWDGMAQTNPSVLGISNTGSTESFSKVKSVAKADLAAGVAGAVGTGIKGFLVGGLMGAAVGVGAGFLGGAIGGSIAAALFD
ncbi:MAG: hypothetical protein SF052_10225 [Bacteroidia bacterium]|nr:hypothetical protein [Bacteroidia bacterium]